MGREPPRINIIFSILSWNYVGPRETLIKWISLEMMTFHLWFMTFKRRRMSLVSFFLLPPSCNWKVNMVVITFGSHGWNQDVRMAEKHDRKSLVLDTVEPSYQPWDSSIYFVTWDRNKVLSYLNNFYFSFSPATDSII